MMALGLALGTLVSCSNDDEYNTVSGGSAKTVVSVAGTVDGVPLAAATRAADDKFAANDMIVAYFQHINDSDAEVAGFSAIKNLKVTGVASSTPYTATLTCTDASGLWWDDFSNNLAAGNDIRETGHGLRTLYAYCYNGGTPSPALTNATGVIGWTIRRNQRAAADFQQSDLLWAPTITKVAYIKGASKDANHGTLTLPFTHAMSKVTVLVEVGDGFASNYAFTNDSVTLFNGTNQFNTVCTATAPTSVLSASGTPRRIMTKKGSAVTNAASKRECKFEAIVVPSVLDAQDEVFCMVYADGNTYSVPVTADMRATAAGKWGSKLSAGDLMQSGVNYVLKVHVDKAKVTLEAYVTDWESVTAETVNGEIIFTPDIVSNSGISATAVTTANANFDIFKAASLSAIDAAGSASATYTYNGTTWTSGQTLYWQNSSDDSYFRALANYDATRILDCSTTPSKTMQQGGTDLLWGVTSAHIGTDKDNVTHNYTEGQVITPRTGNVPLTFHHALSKVSMQLETSTDPAKAVVLTGATISISNLYDEATLTLSTGAADKTGRTVNATAVSAFAPYDGTGAAASKLEQYLMIPQTISDNAKVTVTLADGTTYSLKLKDCVITGTSTKISEWERGGYYFYTIHLEKEVLRMEAWIKDWVETTGSGNAEMDWD